MKKVKIIIGSLLLTISLAILIVIIPLHVEEHLTMKECAATPGCMFCLPRFVGGIGIIHYIISGILILISLLIFISMYLNRTKKIPN